MKRLAIVLAAALLAVAVQAIAMHHDKGEHGGHGGGASMGSMDHAGMMMDAATVMLGDQTVQGVKAVAHLRDVKAAMAKMGMKETHHFMVNFVGKDGKPVTEGTVAVKIENPAGAVGDPIALPGMQGHFGADIVLMEKGTYTFRVGSKLPDGVVRQYEFKHEVK